MENFFPEGKKNNRIGSNPQTMADPPTNPTTTNDGQVKVEEKNDSRPNEPPPPCDVPQAAASSQVRQVVAPRRQDHTYHDWALHPADDPMFRSTKKATNNFPAKLHRILSNPEHYHAISWQPHGRAWKIRDKAALVAEVIPLYFGQSKFESFTRQLSGWGFKRLHQSGPDFNCYYHECFLRGLPHLTRVMKRAEANLGKLLPHVDGEPNFYDMDMEHPLPPAPPVTTRPPAPVLHAYAPGSPPQYPNAPPPPQWDPYNHHAHGHMANAAHHGYYGQPYPNYHMPPHPHYGYPHHPSHPYPPYPPPPHVQQPYPHHAMESPQGSPQGMNQQYFGRPQQPYHHPAMPPHQDWPPDMNPPEMNPPEYEPQMQPQPAHPYAAAPPQQYAPPPDVNEGQPNGRFPPSQNEGPPHFDS